MINSLLKLLAFQLISVDLDEKGVLLSAII
jgi:hypothetical protein